MHLALSAILIGISYLPTNEILNCMLAWLGCLHLVFVVNKKNKISLFEWFVFGLILTGTQFYWAPYIFQKYSQANYIFAFIFAFIIWSYSAIQFVLLGLSLNLFDRKIIALVFIWPILEIIFPKLIPWHLGSTQISFLHLAQIADIGGPALISFVMLSWLALLVNFRIRNIVLVSVSAGIVFAYADYRISQIDTLTRFTSKIGFGVVQPNFDIDQDFSAEALPKRMQKLMTMSGSLFSEEIDLLVWPENAVGFTYQDTQTSIERNTEGDPFPALHIPLLFGAQTQGTNGALFNSAYIMQTDGKLLARYNKQKLFPFSETIPLSGVFPFLKKLFKPAANVMETNSQLAMQFGEIDLATVICFEDLWTGLYPDLLKPGHSQILITLANDGWFANSTAAYQHKMLASWRTIEFRRYMLRATNNGYTELISPTGRVIKSIPAKTAQTMFTGRIPALNLISPYHKLIDI